jgi:hypothetical protein
MSLSPFDSLQSRFVTYLLNFPRTWLCIILHCRCYQTIIAPLLKKYSNFVFHRQFCNLCPLDINGLTWQSLWNNFKMIVIHISCYRPELCLQYKHEAVALLPPQSFTITTVSTITVSPDEPIMHTRTRQQRQTYRYTPDHHILYT